MKEEFSMSAEFIEDSIYIIRGHKVMLDEDLAKLYGVEVKALNQTVRRNLERFPNDFLFRLTEDELRLRSQFATLKKYSENLRSQIVTSSLIHGGRRYLPHAFTEQGIAMLSGLLRSPQAIAVNIEIMRAFVRMRHALASQNKLSKDMEELRSFVLKKSQKNTVEFQRIWSVIEELSKPPEYARKIGFDLSPEK